MAILYVFKTNFSSSNVRGFTRRGNNLIVEFKNRVKYIYFGAAPLYFSMLAAGSKGKFVWREIRDIFPYNRIGGR